MHYRQLRDAKPNLFELAGQAWQRWKDAIEDEERRFAGSVLTPLSEPGIWRGRSAAVARPYLCDLSRTQRHAVDEMEPVPGVLGDFAGELAACQSTLADIEARAAGLGFQVDQASGSVIVPPGLPLPPGRSAESVTADAQRLADEMSDVLRRATEAEMTVVDALNRFSLQDMDPAAGGSAPLPRVPPAGTAPQRVAQWWASLTPGEQSALVTGQSAAIGALDGIPAETRDAANRMVLAAERARLEPELARLQGLVPGPGTPQARELARVQGQLKGIDAIEERLNDTRPGRQQAYLLGLDTDNLGQAIVAIGNPDEADNVVTLVPGTYAALEGAGGGIANVEAIVDQANAADVGSQTAGILWIGYDAPQSIAPAAMDPGYADGAKADLDRFQDGLRATHEGPRSTNTVIGHSYGSTVVGHTARDEGLDADNVIFAGSPGVGVDHARDLGVPAENVWATTAAHDPIQHAYDPEDVSVPIHPLVPTEVANPDPELVHGNNPTDADFGGQVFASDPGSRWPPASAHTEYWRPNSSSLIKVGNIVTGRG
ncbi:MAG: alpha/beta hydrolase [Pseudonocardiaceae bacterium]